MLTTETSANVPTDAMHTKTSEPFKKSEQLLIKQLLCLLWHLLNNLQHNLIIFKKVFASKSDDAFWRVAWRIRWKAFIYLFISNRRIHSFSKQNKTIPHRYCIFIQGLVFLFYYFLFLGCRCEAILEAACCIWHGVNLFVDCRRRRMDGASKALAAFLKQLLSRMSYNPELMHHLGKDAIDSKHVNCFEFHVVL